MQNARGSPDLDTVVAHCCFSDKVVAQRNNLATVRFGFVVWVVWAFRCFFAVWAVAFLFLLIGRAREGSRSFMLFGPGGPRVEGLFTVLLLVWVQCLCFCCLGGRACLFFLLFGQGVGGRGLVLARFCFCCCLGGCAFFVAVWAGGAFSFSLFGRGTGVHSLTSLPGLVLTTENTTTRKNTGSI